MTSRRTVLVLATLLFFWQLGGHDLWAPNEPYFAEGAREMLVDGHWVVPHVNGVVTPDKPPLFFWLIALFSLPVGAVGSLTARLPSALAALATVALVMRLGDRLYGPRTAVLAGAMLSTTYMFWDKARWSQTDALLCCLIWVALSAFEVFRSGASSGRKAGLVFWLASALAVLTKGPIGLLLPLGIALFTLGWDRELGRWRQFAPAAGPLLFAAVLGGWVVLTEVAGPAEYSVWTALKDHFVDRGIHGMHHKQPTWYFLETLPTTLLPWTGLIPGALVLAFRRRLACDRFLLVTVVYVVAFFSISTEKRELYALPAFPAFLLMAAGLVGAVMSWHEPSVDVTIRPDRRWVTIGQALMAAVLVLTAVVIGVAVDRVDELGYGTGLALAAILAGTAIGVGLFLAHGRPLASIRTTVIGFALTLLVAITWVVPNFESRKSARPFALRIKEVTLESRARGLPILTYELETLPERFAFYSDGVYTKEAKDIEDLARHLERAEQVFAVVHGGRLAGLPSEVAKEVFVVDSTHLARREVLLLANYAYPEAEPLLAEPELEERR